MQLRGVTCRLGDTGSVDLLVVCHVELLDSKLRHPVAESGSLDVIGRHDARVRALSGRVVLLRRTLAAGAGVLRQLERRVRRADLNQARLVDDRDRDRRRARVELAQVGDRRLVLGRLAGVRGHRARLPLAGRRRRVVERDVLDRVLADLAAGFLQRDLLAVDHRLGLRPVVALQRQAGVDGELRGAGRTAPCALVVAAPAAASQQREGRERRARKRANLADVHHPATIHRPRCLGKSSSE